MTPTLAELESVSTKLGIEVSDSATTESLTESIYNFEFTQTVLEKCVKAELKTICDVLEITYDSDATNKELIELILANTDDN